MSSRNSNSPSAIVPVIDDPQEVGGDVTAPVESAAWWTRYRQSVQQRLSSTALNALEADARYVVEQAIPRGDGYLDTAAWPTGRVRTGMVVGSVQSGKTASMFGVAAMALDASVDLIILLAGTRVSLWLQTYQRLLTQLDGSDVENAYRRKDERLILPKPADILQQERLQPQRYLQRPITRRALKERRPIICVVPKEDEHLMALSRFLKEMVSPSYLEAREDAFSMLVLDDEADDASVLDSQASQKLTPKLIASLWSGDTDVSSTRHPNLYATYVAYTATPQANFLQASHNPLSPRDFGAALRTPGTVGDVAVRSVSYMEPKGVNAFYCGGDIFYERIDTAARGSLCQSFSVPQSQGCETTDEFWLRSQAQRHEMLSEALRSFLVGAAIRALTSDPAQTYDQTKEFESIEEAVVAASGTHTMLVHPSAKKSDHFEAALEIVRWAASRPGEEDDYEVSEEEERTLKLCSQGLARRLDLEEGEWSKWLEEFEASRISLSTLPNSPYRSISRSDWPLVKEALVSSIFPNVQLRVLNSDPASSDRPSFEPQRVENGYKLPPDNLSIFVAGNVLSRGLTLEGLTTSLFLRNATEPAADTQMQMQRWFGYRGGFLPFCRVFLHDDQLELFRRYNVNDLALKSEIVAAMDNDEGVDISALVLQGANFVATNKVEARKVPLSPGPKPSIRLVETSCGDFAEKNIAIASDLLSEGEWVTLKDDNGYERGIIKTQPVDLTTLAETLERFRFSHHDPSLDNELSRRWWNYARLLKADEPLFNPPSINRTGYSVSPQGCPYSIAAYLRLWAHLMRGSAAPGFYPTDRPEVQWNYSDAVQTAPPVFYLAFRKGSVEARDPQLRKHGVKAVVREQNLDGRTLKTLWGTRGYGGDYYGDEFVDYYFHKTSGNLSNQGDAMWRPRGHPGLALFHVVSSPHTPTDQLALGLGLPHGGPDHIAALRK